MIHRTCSAIGVARYIRKRTLLRSRILARRAVTQLFGLKCFDILKPINNAAAEFDEMRALARPPPALERAVRNVPAISKVDLIKVSGHNCHSVEPRSSGLRYSPWKYVYFRRCERLEI